MAKQEKKGTGFQASAGLIRYFDAEEKTALRIDPKFVVGLSIATAVLVLAAWYFFPLA